MKPDLRADYKIRLYTGPKTLFFEVSKFTGRPAHHLDGIVGQALKIIVNHRTGLRKLGDVAAPGPEIYPSMETGMS